MSCSCPTGDRCTSNNVLTCWLMAKTLLVLRCRYSNSEILRDRLTKLIGCLSPPLAHTPGAIQIGEPDAHPTDDLRRPLIPDGLAGEPTGGAKGSVPETWRPGSGCDTGPPDSPHGGSAGHAPHPAGSGHPSGPSLLAKGSSRPQLVSRGATTNRDVAPRHFGPPMTYICDAPNPGGRGHAFRR